MQSVGFRPQSLQVTTLLGDKVAIQTALDHALMQQPCLFLPAAKVFPQIEM